MATILYGLMAFFALGIGSSQILLEKILSITVRRIIAVPSLIFIIGTPMYLISTYTKWVQKFINTEPRKSKIVEVQTAGDDQEDLANDNRQPIVTNKRLKIF